MTLGILGALGALHSRQIVHRDLKPSNVFLTDDGIKLLDFGLARSRQSLDGEEQTLTKTGMVVGTPRYMAPEQWSDGRARSAIRSVRHRRDAVRDALGATGVPGQRPDAGLSRGDVRHSRPHLTGSAAVSAIDGVIHRALEKRPEDRYHTAEAMAQALRSAMTLTTDTSTVTVRPTTRLIALPFRMLRPDPDVDFLSFSLPDAVLSSLAGIQSLVVRSTLAGAGYATDEGVDLKKIAAEAGVDAVLCGTLLRAGGTDSRERTAARSLVRHDSVVQDDSAGAQGHLRRPGSTGEGHRRIAVDSVVVGRSATPAPRSARQRACLRVLSAGQPARLRQLDAASRRRDVPVGAGRRP